ncbi:DUF421 domain-containing protein [Amphibacillus indicireducens]|uniref:DUF421 domain-containing protein n=1 Tax=Amphibacillus indicireducens TaxID=1076330 RepID=A0ABP7V1S6_9BACI
MYEYGLVFIEVVFGFFALFVMAKVLGKTQIRQLTAFDFISALLLGELVGNALYDEQIGLIHMAFAIGTWGGLMYGTEFITQRFKGSRALLEGKPAIIINKGKLDREAMKKNKLDMNQFQHLLRLKNVFSLKDVEYAILENDGTVSVLEKTRAQAPTRKDLKLQDEKVYLPITLINDGEVIKDNLAEINRDEAWLKEQIKQHNVKSIKEIFYAEYQEEEPLHIQLM